MKLTESVPWDDEGCEYQFGDWDNPPMKKCEETSRVVVLGKRLCGGHAKNLLDELSRALSR
jgi:hypothetical protein